MSQFTRVARGLCLVLAASLAATTARAERQKFQAEVFGLTTLLSGSSSLAEGHERTDLYSPGIGYSLGATMGLTDHLRVGVRTGMFRDQKDLPPALALSRWKALPGYSSFRASQATSIHRKLTAIPTHAVVQYRHRLPGKLTLYDEIGAGVASFTEKVSYEGAGGTRLRLSAYQKNLSLLVGGGVSWDYRNIGSIVAGVDVQMIPSRDGQVWNGGDNPQFVNFEFGLRYPRR